VGYLYCIGNPRTDWLYQTEPEPGLNGRRLRYPRGRTLGGCSSINGMIYMRGQARDYDEWARLTGDPAWGWARCWPDFVAHENHHRLDRPATPVGDGAPHNWHGHPQHTGAGTSTGEWRVEAQRLRWDILDAFAAAAQQAGIPATADFNTGNNEGVGYFEVNQKTGWRWNTSKAFLQPVRHRRNLEVRTGAQVLRLLLDTLPNGTTRCTGLVVRQGATETTLHAHHGVVLSAGAINSPHLLQLSGIGPADLLHSRGVPVQVNLPGVGANLQDHLQIRSVYKVRGASTLNTQAASWWGKARIGLAYALTRSGPMSMAPSQLGAFTRSSPDQPWPNVQYHVQPLSLDAFGEPLHPFPAITASVCNLNPSSRGTVHLRSPRPEDPPAIAPNYLSTPSDVQVAVDSLRLTRRIVAQPALARYQPDEYKPGLQFQTDSDLARLAGDIATTIFHPVGTTAMGHDHNPMAVLDSHCRLRDGRGGLVQGLRVVDAGAMPTITSGNTNSPTLMLAEKVARWLVAETGPQPG
jgi:choline dehydrogenase